MSNLNPSLIHGQAIDWLGKNEKISADMTAREWCDLIHKIDLRVYVNDGVGFYFIRGYAPVKWYYDDDPNDGHFNNCSTSDVEKNIKAGGRVQLCGPRGESLGMWKNWETFTAEVMER